MAIQTSSSNNNNNNNNNSSSGGANLSTAAMMLDWIDNHCGADLLGCDESCAATTQQVFSNALHIRHQQHPSYQYQQSASQRQLQPVEFAELHAQWHDELLEVLLNEQTACENDLLDESSSNLTVSSTNSSNNNNTATTTTNTTSHRKRRRPVRLTRRRSPPRIGRAPLLDTSNSSLSTVPLELSSSKTKPSGEYLHPQCRLQKDKGRGEPVGSNLCAKGRTQCLEKLRQKMSLLAEHAKGGKATMKRRKARVSVLRNNFCETRSLLELRMGFLSMQYGVLLRWDTEGKVTLVVLRKMCHDTFYPKKPFAAAAAGNALTTLPLSSLVAVHAPNKHATVQSPGKLQIVASSATGLTRKASWSVQLAYEDCMETFSLKEDAGVWIVQGSPQLVKTLPNVHRLSPLEIKLFQQPPRRGQRQRRLVTSMRIPLQGLKLQSKPTKIQLPCQDAVLQLELLLRGDPPRLSSLSEPPPRQQQQQQPPVVEDVVEMNDEENDDPWEWICCVC